MPWAYGSLITSSNVMLKRIYHRIATLTIALPLMLLTSCQNDGEIGTLYGQWQLTTAQLETTTITQPTQAYFAFQNNVIFGRVITDDHYADFIQGVWVNTGDSLLLSFYTDDNNADIVTNYLTHRYLMTDDPRNLRFGLQCLDNDRLTLTQGNNRWTFRRF